VGADLLITSAHKVLPAYSQAALLVADTTRLDPARLDRAFDASFTTSPAGSILASIDASRALLAAPLGRELLERQLQLVASARVRLRAAGLSVPGPDEFAPGRFDPAKLVVRFDRADGTTVERALIDAGVPVEQADRDTLVAVVTMLDDEHTLDRLCATIIAASESDRANAPRPTLSSWTLPTAPQAMSPREAFFAAHAVVPATTAVGRVSAELIAPYPPGIPVLVPGEVITAETIDALETAARNGVRIAYARDPALASYLVVE
jgi:lysine decarboxylase